jgi:hypothetical protein
MKTVEPNLQTRNAAENHEMSAVMEISVPCFTHIGPVDV